jgi:cytochrome P450
VSQSVPLRFPFANPEPLQPPVEWAELRTQCPVAHVALPSSDPAVLVTRYADVKQVLSDPRFPRSAAASARLADTESGGMFNSEMAQTIPSHGDAHQRWRRLLTKWFTVRRMRALEPRIEAMADQLVDDMIASGAPADLRDALGFPLPVWVICDMLGVPDSDRDKFAHWSDSMLSLTRYTQAEMDAAAADFLAYMQGHVEAKRGRPSDDLLSDLIAAGDADEGTALSDALLVYTAQGLLVAGHETTANMIGKMVAMLLADRSRWQAVAADPSLVASTVEESLRFDAHPGLGMMRYLTEELEVAGQVLPAGTSVMCSMGAANRDEAVYSEPERMDLARTPNAHLTFGAGPHSCVGQALARTELQVVLRVLLRRLPTLELAVSPAELQPVEGLAVGGFSTVPVRW